MILLWKRDYTAMSYSLVICGHGIFVLVENQNGFKWWFDNVIKYMFKGFDRLGVHSIVWKSVPNLRG